MKRTGILAVLGIGLVVVAFSCLAFAQPPDQQKSSTLNLEDPIPVDPDITIGQLENGLRYYIRVNQKPANRAQLRLAVNAGSILEGDDQQGLAHFVEHMAFNGTKHFPGHELIDYLETVGVTFGYGANAYTSFDETVYKLEVPTDSVEVVEKAFQILEDWAHLVTLDEGEIDKERGVVIEEWRRRLGAGDRMLNKKLPIIFKDSRYAERLPIGKKELIETCPPDALRRYYEDWYRPDLMAVIAVGDFDKDWTLGLIEKHFGGLPKTQDPKERVVHPVPDHKETLFAIVTDPEATGTRVGVYYKSDVSPKKTIGDYRRRLVERLYDVMLNYRLFELRRKADPPFLSARAGKGRFVRSKMVYYLSASVEEEGIDRGLEALLTEAERVKKFGFHEAEFERAKRRILRIREKWFDERDKVYSFLYAGKCLAHFLRDEPIPGFANEFELCRGLMPGIQLEEVNHLVHEWMTDENRVIFADLPEKEGLPVPSEDQLSAVFESVEKKDIGDYVETVLDEPLLAELPEPGEIVDEKELKEVEITEWTLSNGVRVVLKPTDFQSDRIMFRALSPGGNSLVPDDKYVSARVACEIIGGGGVGAFDKDQLRKKLTDKIATVRPYIAPLREGLSGGCSAKDVETLFELIYLRMTSPRKSSEAYQSYLTRAKGYLENADVSPEGAFRDTIKVTVSSYHYRSRPWSRALLDEIELDTAFKIYEDRFADASDFTFIFVGNLDLEEMKPLVETYLGGLPVLDRKETWKDPGIVPPKGVVKKKVRKGIEPKSIVRLIFAGPLEWSKEEVYAIESMMNVMRIRLREVIREDSSGTYHVSSYADCSLYPKQKYRIDIGFGCDPERVESLTGAIFDQIDSLKTIGPGEIYITKVKETQKRRHESRLESNGFWIYELDECYFIGEDPREILDYPELVESLSADVIRETANKYFDTSNYIRVVLMPAAEE